MCGGVEGDFAGGGAIREEIGFTKAAAGFPGGAVGSVMEDHVVAKGFTDPVGYEGEVGAAEDDAVYDTASASGFFFTEGLKQILQVGVYLR